MFPQALGEAVKPVGAVGGFAVNVAETVQLLVMAPVWKVVPESEPPQPDADAVYPAFGVTINKVDCVLITPVREDGKIVPPAPAEPVTV